MARPKKSKTTTNANIEPHIALQKSVLDIQAQIINLTELHTKLTGYSSKKTITPIEFKDATFITTIQETPKLMENMAATLSDVVTNLSNALLTVK